MKKIVLASNNTGKLQEFEQLFSTLNIKIIPQKEFDVTDIEETGATFVENAIIKARHASKLTGLPALADDSGLVIDILEGAPGIFSARYAGGSRDAKANYEKVLQEMQDVSDDKRTAHFHSCLVLMHNASDPEPLITAASWYGRILRQATGENGFGYDPIFFVPEYQCSAAELESPIKNKISHRGKALKLLYNKLDRKKSHTRPSS